MQKPVVWMTRQLIMFWSIGKTKMLKRKGKKITAYHAFSNRSIPFYDSSSYYMSLTNFYGCLYGCAWYITEVTRICWFINILPNILLSWPFFWNLLKSKINRLNPLCAMSIDVQYAATVQCCSQLLREDRYAIYVLLTFTLAVMWSIKSSPTSGSVCNTFGSAGDPQIVLTGSSLDEVGVVRVDHPSYLMTLQLKIWFGVFQVVRPCSINHDCCVNSIVNFMFWSHFREKQTSRVNTWK